MSNQIATCAPAAPSIHSTQVYAQNTARGPANTLPNSSAETASLPEIERLGQAAVTAPEQSSSLRETALPADPQPGARPLEPVPSHASGLPVEPHAEPDENERAGTMHRNELNLEHLLQQFPDLPSQAMVLGVCEDGLPVLIDLNDPTPGAVLILSDERDQQIEMLRTAIASVVTRSSPHQVQVVILSSEPQDWQKWVAGRGFQRHTIAIERAESEIAGDWILRLADWTEQRRLGQLGGPAVLLVMDTLSFLPNLAYDVRLNFEWMAKEGPPAAVWPLATCSTDLAKVLNSRHLLRAFKTRILGFARDSAETGRLVNLSEEIAADLSHTGQFMVQAGENWLRFRLPGS